jgi:hypothetical protein
MYLIAQECFRYSSNGKSQLGIQSHFEDLEGFCPIDGSCGINLYQSSSYKFSLDNIDLETNDED